MIRLCLHFSVLALGLASALVPATAPAAPASMVTAAGAPITVEVGKGQLVRLERPVNTVFVADPDTADVQVKSPTLLYVFGKAGGATTLFAVGEHDEVVLSAPVRVRYDIGRIQEAIHELAPRSAVSVNSIEDSLVIDGTVYSASEGDDIRRVAERFLADPKMLINRMKVDAPNQVNLRVRIAEISRDLIKELGFNWDALTNNNTFLFGLASGPNPTTLAPGLFNTRTLSTDLKTTVDNLFGSLKYGNADVNALIDALDAQGLITVLAEPNLTAVSGEPASFLAGGEFPIPVSSAVQSGVVQVTVDWKKYGVSLNFVATVGAGNRISLRVMPEVSELSTVGAVVISGIQLPALTTRRADTTVDLASGQSFAIAGLLSNDVSQQLQKFPWLADLPILGQLFRSESFRRQESEVVIIVTPYLVRPVATANRLQLPTDGYVTSSTNDFVFRGAEYKPQLLKKGAAPVSRSGSGLIGPSGFDLD
jgi:pilus assembly protein CpaC